MSTVAVPTYTSEEERAALAKCQARYASTSDPSILFPWKHLLEDDVRIQVAVEVLIDLLDQPLEAYAKYTHSATTSDYAVAYRMYAKYTQAASLTWFYNSIADMLENMWG